ncbi:GNAT family N-acetyltransferase [Streptomyces sp. LX-29]|uniref:GNAT family N-acetyltransferase n=1 Tax=Streptomyces sp. LX-29 TaxID=2900152 RepID=UPI00240E334B|nr:GNAT family N-acetyltransferase [Streptomyces sp. LX-29]WFB08049.1 GNAT family N-acetyltransferase [Streptomyces sp. LX-29]
MPLTDLDFVRDPELTPALREEVLQLWTRVSQAGGAVGFVPPVTAEEIRPTADAQAAAVASGALRMLAAYEEGRLVGTSYLKLNTHPLMRHWSTVVTVMIDPERQGGGRGKALMRETVEMARDLGFSALRLGVRGGMGTEDFYATVGFKEVGRVPEGIDVGGGDLRDDILMWLPLK